MSIIEVFADVGCPFTHVGLRRLVDTRASLGLDAPLRVHPWPLEIVNGTPLDPAFIAEEVDEIRAQVAPDLFTGFRESAFPSSSIPAMALAEAAYRSGMAAGEQVSLALRSALFEDGRDIADPDVLDEVASTAGVGPATGRDVDAVRASVAAGRARDVIGSPHFFAGGAGYFCPALDIARVDGHLRITADEAGFDAFLHACLGA